MKILITGAKGFIGRNLIAELKNRGYTDILQYDTDTELCVLHEYAKECDFVFHLAGVNRPKEPEEYRKGNFEFTSELVELLTKHKNTCPVMMASSIQAELDNPYGISKKAGEDLLFSYGRETGAKVLVYRFPNVFGKWCKPNYNSAVATFCHNVAHGLPIQVNDPGISMNLVYIDDVVEELFKGLGGSESKEKQFCTVPMVYQKELGAIAELIYSFKENRNNLNVPNMSDPFEKKLYSTYISYLPTDQFSYPLTMKVDPRGSFTEIIRTMDRGQFSVNITKPGITKGNHWHNSKNEKFLVVSGKGQISFRKIDTKEVIEYTVSGDKMEVVDIPTGYTHNIRNIGDTDLVTFMWASESFDPKKPDTYVQKV